MFFDCYVAMCSVVCISLRVNRVFIGSVLRQHGNTGIEWRDDVSQFTPGELRVMQCLWEHGEQKPMEIQSRFGEPIKNAALRSYLSILLEKGHVTRRQVGKAYYYKAITPERSARNTMLQQLVEVFFGGSKERLIASLVKTEKLTASQLQELAEIANSPSADSKSNDACGPKPRKDKSATRYSSKRIKRGKS